MSLFAELKKREELARTEGKKLVNVLTEAEATAAGATTANIIVIDEAPVVFRQCVVNNIENMGETVSKKDSKTYVRVAMIGRDLGSNGTLRTWAIFEKAEKLPEVGDIAEFPCVHIPHGKFGYANDSIVQPLKPEGAYQHTNQKNAEIWNEARMQGFAKAVAAVTVAKELTAVGR